MTTNRDFDGLARAWLDLMPDEAPDRLIANVRLAVDVTPQQRTWGGLAFRRPFQMTRFALVSATAVVALALVGGVILVGTARPSPTAPGPTPSGPTTDGPSSAAPEDLPADLIGGWYGGPRDLPLLTPGAGTVLFLEANQARLSSSRAQQAALLQGSASVVDGRVQLVSTLPEEYAGGVSCPRGTPGLYDVSVSPSGRTLTVRRFSDPCFARSTVLEGTWWKKGCWQDGECYGLLDPGTYGTQNFDPRVDPGAAWAPSYGALTFSVPDGWALASDGPSGIRLTPDYLGELANGGVATGLKGEIHVISQPFPFIGGADCERPLSPSLDAPRSPTDIVTFLEAQPWLVASRPSTNLIDGRVVTELELSITPGSRPGCPEDTDPNGQYLTLYGPHAGGDLGLAGDQRAHLWLIDLGAGDVVAVTVMGRDAAALDGFVAIARPVIETFRFE
jgi:hypothetical protein